MTHCRRRRLLDCRRFSIFQEFHLQNSIFENVVDAAVVVSVVAEKTALACASDEQ